LAFAARRDLPAGLAERLSALLLVDRHSPARLMQLLRGEMQHVLLRRIGVKPQSYYHAGTYDPLETAELFSSRFLTMVRDAGAPGTRRSRDDLEWYQTRNRLRSQLWAGGYWLSNSETDTLLARPVKRVRLNNTRNSIGRVDVETYPDFDLLGRMRRARTE